jgi:hypothetical protein
MKLTKERVLELGFKELPHFTVMDSLIYNLGRNRQLSIGCIGTCNEFMYISEIDEEDSREVNELICIHNYDFNGYLTEEKLSLILTFFSENKK